MRGVNPRKPKLKPGKEFAMDILRLFFDCDEFCRHFELYLSAKQLFDGFKVHLVINDFLALCSLLFCVVCGESLL
jgi:hypothetical protein